MFEMLIVVLCDMVNYRLALYVEYIAEHKM